MGANRIPLDVAARHASQLMATVSMKQVNSRADRPGSLRSCLRDGKDYPGGRRQARSR